MDSSSASLNNGADIIELSDDDDEAPELLDVGGSNIDDGGNDLTANLIASKDTNQYNSNSKNNNKDTSVLSNTADLPPCPVTILSGFLGSGKTTLIQYILQSPDHGYRIAIIENEFGGDNSDSEGNNKGGLSIESLIATDGSNNNSSLVDLLELPNGCVCCTVKDSLVTTLEVLLNKRQDLDYIIIECSGMANPGPIATLFWLDDALESRLRLDGIVTLVDAVHITHQLQSTLEASQQVAYADRILLNKIDLIKHDNENVDIVVQSLIARLRQINPTALIRPTSYSQVPDLDWILNARCFDLQRAQEIEQMYVEINDNSSRIDDNNNNNRLQNGDEHNHTHDHDHTGPCTDDLCQAATTSHNLPQHAHTDAVTTISLYEKGSVNLPRLHKWLAAILWPQQDVQNSVLTELLVSSSSSTSLKPESTDRLKKPDNSKMEIFRMKGILSVCVDTSENKDNVITDDDDSAVQLDSKGLDPRYYILQAVHDLWEVYPSKDKLWDDVSNSNSSSSSSSNDTQRCCKVIVIGRNLDEAELRQEFKNCIV